MSNEEFERYKDFILEQQAQSAVKVAQIEENLARLSENMSQLVTNTTLLAEGTVARFEATDKRIDDLDEKMSALVDSQLRTEVNLKNLIAVVDRYFSEGRNGKSES